jgi:hypothetical protein
MKTAKKPSWQSLHHTIFSAKVAWRVRLFDQKHLGRGGLDRSAIQLERKAARPHSSLPGPLRQGRATSRVLRKVSQETLAEMIGTTRSRVNFFMNKFRKLGFIKYNGGLQNTSLLNVVLQE